MTVSRIRCRRRRARTAPRLVAGLVLLCGAIAAPVQAAVISWNAGNGSWNNAANWSPNVVPTLGDVVRIGNLPGVQDSTVLIFGGAGFETVEISDGMTLDLNNTEFVTFGNVSVLGANSRLIARPILGPNVHDLQGVLHIGAGANLQLVDNVPVRFFSGSESAGTISGRGEIQILSAPPFTNDGIIDPDGNGGIVLTAPLNSIDLDGISGVGHLLLNTPFSELEVNTSGLSDSFSGTISMVPGALLTMNLADGWATDANSSINVAGTDNPAAASQIAGSELTMGGMLNVGGAQGHLRVTAAATIAQNSTVNVGDGDWLEFDGTTTIEGGQQTLGQGGLLDFNGPSFIHGGTFATAGVEDADGDVDFNGATTWSGNVTIDGRAQQNGNATVSAPTVINAQLFDFSGDDGLTNWDVNAPLVINTVENKTHPFDFFHGVMDIGGGVLNRFTLNFIGNDELGWVMDGELNLAGSEFFFANRVAGARVVNGGEINISDSKVEISAGMNFMPWGIVNFAAPESELRMRGRSWIAEGATFNGEGTLLNGIGGEMLLYDGASLEDVGLVNQGDLHISDDFWLTTAGLAAVDRFTNDDDGTLHIRLGGYALGAEHSHLLVTGDDASLDGLLEVLLIDDGDGLFLPQLGDEFSILTALGGVTGQFENSPVSLGGGKQFHWSVIYNPFDVRLRLDEIVAPEPQTLLLAVLGAVAALFHRHGKGEHTMSAAPKVASAC